MNYSQAMSHLISTLTRLTDANRSSNTLSRLEVALLVGLFSQGAYNHPVVITQGALRNRLGVKKSDSVKAAIDGLIARGLLKTAGDAGGPLSYSLKFPEPTKPKKPLRRRLILPPH